MVLGEQGDPMACLSVGDPGWRAELRLAEGHRLDDKALRDLDELAATLKGRYNAELRTDDLDNWKQLLTTVSLELAKRGVPPETLCISDPHKSWSPQEERQQQNSEATVWVVERK